MSATMEIAIFLVLQSLVILGALAMAYVKVKVSIAHLQRDVVHLGEIAEHRGENHKTLTEKVDGISRTVARLEGIKEAS